MKITVEMDKRIVTIETDDGDVNAESLVFDYFHPIMLALGFHPNTVKNYLGEM